MSSNNLSKLDRWKRGDRFSASHMNQSVDLINAMAPLIGGKDISVVQGNKGTSISYVGAKYSTLMTPLKIVSNGTPGSEYNVIPGIVCKYIPVTGSTFDPKDSYAFPPEIRQALAINQAEIGKSTHDLTIGEVYWGILIKPLGDSNNKKPVYLIVNSTSENLGQYQGMVHTMVSQNQDGWDFFMAVSPVPFIIP